MSLKLFTGEVSPVYMVRGPHGWIECDRNMVDQMLPRRGKWRHPDPAHWHQVRAIVLERFGWACATNLDHRDYLDAHHRTYVRWGHELPEDLTVFCRKCHELYEVNHRFERAA